tara:strand:- start:595 stop:732 length:138 start_codon:yes stop_codon:yes gene_type:complete
MYKKATITTEEECQLLTNILTDDCPVSARILEIHYQNKERENDED